jgi:hypothetical protein
MIAEQEITIPHDVLQAGQAACDHFVRMINAGESERMAEMLALRSPPSAYTDREFFAGRHTLAQQFAGDDRGLATLLRAAKRNGYTPRATDVYEPGLCRNEVGQGDPQAFIPSSEGRGKATRILEARGSSAYGAVKLRGGSSREKDDRPIADDCINRLLKKAVAQDPSLAKASKRDQKAEMIRRHSKTTKGK